MLMQNLLENICLSIESSRNYTFCLIERMRLLLLKGYVQVLLYSAFEETVSKVN